MLVYSCVVLKMLFEYITAKGDDNPIRAEMMMSNEVSNAS